MPSISSKPKVALFVTCLADVYRPNIGFSTLALLEAAGCDVEVPESQTCCGQPAFNSGDKANAQAIAKNTIEAFEGYEYVVGPSGSCVGMLHYYVDLFDEADPWHRRAKDLKARSFEITQFLVDELNAELPKVSYNKRVTYHDSCSGLRQLGIKQQPRELLKSVCDVDVTEMDEAETCCGFGGTFCVKYPEISDRMVSNKVENSLNTMADTLVGGDLGCLLNIAGKVNRQGEQIETRHIVEILADQLAVPAITKTESQR